MGVLVVMVFPEYLGSSNRTPSQRQEEELGKTSPIPAYTYKVIKHLPS